jgi:DNA-binding response OmpR family regulator
MRVLMVDDETEFVTALAERLSFRGIEADYATKAADALLQVEKKTYDLAVLDMKMPGISGIELKGLLEKKCPAMKFIFLTGHGSEEDYIAGSSEAHYYLVKPVNIDTLISKMMEATK